MKMQVGQIGKKFILYLVLFSFLITLVFSVIQLHHEFHLGLEAIEMDHEHVRESHKDSMTHSVWLMDRDQIGKQLSGLLYIPHISKVAVHGENSVILELKSKNTREDISTTIPLFYNHRGRDVDIGKLVIVSSLEYVHQGIVYDFAVILLSNIVKSLLFAVFCSFVFNYLVVRHLKDFIGYIKGQGQNEEITPYRPLKTQTKQGQMDELDEVFHAYNRSITARKMSDTFLRESERMARVLLNVTTESFVLLKPDGTFLTMNAVAAKRFGCNPHELVGRCCYGFFPREVAAVRKKKITELIQKNKSIQFEDTRSGRVFENRLYPVHNARGEIDRIAVFALDVTENKATVEKLRALNERFSKVFQASPDAIVITRLVDTGLIDVNYSFEKMFGHPKENCIGETERDLLLWADYNQREKIIAPLREGKAIRDVENKGRRSSGEIFDVSISSDTITIQGEVCLVSIVRDISDRKAAEKEKKELETQLWQSQKNESMGALASGIAHDFNNILSAIVGYTEIAIATPHDSNKRENALQQVLTASLRATDLVEQILAFGRKSDQEIRPVQIPLIVRETLKLLRSSFPAAIEIKQDIAGHCGMVMGDATQIHQVVMNLCTNAYHAMKDSGGVLSVFLHPVQLGHGEDAAPMDLEPGAYLKLEVRDTGKGVPKEVQEKIFEPYYTTRPKGEGTGLGLSVVQGIVWNMQGRISVESEPNSHTSFKIFMPALDLPGESVIPEIEHLPPKGHGHILLVDDHPVFVQINMTMIEKLGYTVTALTDSRDALRVFKNQPGDFDLVITDMIMPNMTGDLLAEEILELRPDMPIIVLTGHGDPMTRKRVKAMGVRGYLKKPVLQRVLVDTIRKLLDEDSTTLLT